MFDPHDAKTVVVRATFGLLVTHDGGDSWRWICDGAIGFPGTEDPSYAITPKGTLVGGTSAGIAVSRDGGCNFSYASALGGSVLSDLAMQADGEIVGISSIPAKADGAVYDNHLVVSKDDARTFAVSGGPIDPTLHLESIQLAPSDPVRLYVSAVRGEGEKRAAAFLVSYDAGMSWVVRKLELLGGETAALVASVDPKNADRVYVRTDGPVDVFGRLLVTDDAGKTWKKVLETSGPLRGFVLAEDGKRVFVGARDGVSSSPTDSFAFTKGSSIETQCLAMTGNALWACSTERSGFLVGSSRSGGRSFDARLHLDEIKGPLECAPESSVAKACTAEWPKLRRDLGLPEIGEKPRSADTGGPALRGRAQRTGRSRSSLAAFAGIALVALAGYTILQRLRRR
ncbi:MAG: BNR/Asp-box repeat domain protein [Labilithrix sp.]|nr:BNR/Asp-box repeat domain protein [Labilithrix sp.]